MAICVRTVGQGRGASADLTDSIIGLNWSSVAPGGDERCTFSLKRQWFSGAPEIAQGNLLYVDDGLTRLWTGRIEENDRATSDSEYIGVTAYGLGIRLKDDQKFERCYVHNALNEWADVRGFTDAALGTYTAAWEVQASDRGIALSLPTPATATTGTAAKVVLDTGPTETGAKRIIVTYKGGGAADLGLYASNSDTPSPNTEATTLDGAPVATGSTTTSFTFTTARRYVGIYLKNDAVGTLTGSETSWVQITNVIVVRDTAYESGDASILKASQVVTDAVGQVAGITLQRNDATANVLPHFMVNGTAEDAITEANRYENGDWGTFGPSSGLDTSTNGYFSYTARDGTTAHWVCRRADCDDVALQVELASLYNAVSVDYADANGQRGTERRTAAVAVLDQAGITREARIDGGTLTQAGAQTLGDKFLDLTAKESPARGSVALSVPIRHYQRGTLPPWFMAADGSNISISDVLPSKDALSLSASADRRTLFPIRRVSVDASGEMPRVSVEVDQVNDTLSALQARLGLAAQFPGPIPELK